MKKQLLALALMSTAFVSCTDDSYDLDNMSSDFRIGLNEYLPIVSSEVKLKDILNEFKTDYISEDEEGVLNFQFDTINHVIVDPVKILFKESNFEYSVKDIKEISDLTSVVGGTSFTVKVPVDLSFDDENGTGKIDSIYVKEGLMRFGIEINGKESNDVAITSTNLPIKGLLGTMDGFDLSDRMIDLSKVDSIDITLTVVEGAKISISNSMSVKVKMYETPLSYYCIYGSFMSKIEQIERTDFYINLYDDNVNFKLNVIDPNLRISATTNSGIPLECTVKGLVGKHKTKKTVKKDSVEAVFLGFNGKGSKTFTFPFESANKPGTETEAFDVTFNSTNGSLDKIFNYMPDSVSVACGIKINADPKSGISYFLLDSTYLDLKIEASVPLQIGDSSFITIHDTIDNINIVQEITDYQNGEFLLDEAEVFVEFENALPLEAVITAKFCKADTLSNGDVKLTRIQNTKLDQTVRIPAAQVTNGFVTKAKPSVTKIKVSEDMVEDIKKINAVDFTYNIKVPKGSVDGIFLTNDCGMSAKVYGHLKANISKTEK